MKQSFIVICAVLGAAAVLTGCDTGEGDVEESVTTAQQELHSEKVSVEELMARANRMFKPIPESVTDVDDQKVELGRALYHDKGLSADGTVSCATCHVISEGGGDNLPTSTGIKDQVGPIHSPTVLNARYHFVQFWDGRAATLEEQALGPVEDPLEMGNQWDDVVGYLAGEPHYADAFEELYGGEITKENAAHAIAEFERTLITPNAPFDQFLRGDENALNEQELAGLQAFMENGCTACHGGKILSSEGYQKLGLVHDYFEDRGTELTDADLGRYNVTGEESDKHFFKVPTLRNVELTHPYYHDGQVETLEEAIWSMGWHQLGRDLDEETVDDIVAFLLTLTGEIPDVSTDPVPRF
jgi:cytochrome c peroxidase